MVSNPQHGIRIYTNSVYFHSFHLICLFICLCFLSMMCFFRSFAIDYNNNHFSFELTVWWLELKRKKTAIFFISTISLYLEQSVWVIANLYFLFFYFSLLFSPLNMNTKTRLIDSTPKVYIVCTSLFTIHSLSLHSALLSHRHHTVGIGLDRETYTAFKRNHMCSLRVPKIATKWK